ncbi:hypothetical protein N1F89_01015 [Aquibium sp. A9E412]|uniref:hypothetical protein n=1 Tax=Aquibium sp. A9E412 TaxID=2976767 RepID=UPI0025AF4C1E|nr:hypothetical protein [Aquibium sp. A9E412]MDN2564792.1 hypothetical protein [Aquibium sp. A9E412]
MNELPNWVEILAALLTPTIAVAVAVVAYRQWRTAHSRLVLDLFDRRLLVYQKVRRSVRVVNISGKTSREAEIDLLEAIDAARFLFGRDVQKYLDGLWESYIFLKANTKMAESDDESTRNEASSKAPEHKKDILSFYDDSAKVFSPYMRMDHKLPN